MCIDKFINMTIFSSSSKKADKAKCGANNTINQQSYTAKNQTEPSVKCYVGVASDTRNRPYDIASLLSGKMDRIFKARNDANITPSVGFKMFCTIIPKYDDNKLNPAVSAASRGHGENTSYLLEMGYGEEEVKLLAAKVCFSKAIVRAWNAQELCNELMYHSKIAAKPIENPAFDPTLLQQSPNMKNVTFSSR